MTIKELNTLPLGTELWFREGKMLSMPCWLKRHTRDSHRRVMVTTNKLLDNSRGHSWFAHPRQLSPVKAAE